MVLPQFNAARTRPMNDVTKKSNAPVSYAEKAWQSDVIVDLIKHYDFPYIALNPRASYRGLHDTMGIYYAYIHRCPVFVSGAPGPMDESRRRPFIDWIHTANVNGEQL